MSIPIWITAMVTQILACWASGRTGWRFPFILLGIAIVLIGWCIQVYYSDHQLSAGARYFSLYCMAGGTFIQMAITTSWMVNNLRGRASIAVGTAIILGLGNCANFVASNVFITTEAPHYPTGFKTGLGITIAGAVFCLAFLGLLVKHNRKLDAKRKDSGGVDTQEEYRYIY
jgi:peptidoglycan/LPS O-acetylase OafA/YrhL